ncbi:MAG: isoleucine--tRNA ligase [Herpetosiphonaceae bacterium]|nr:MAG: isoleucine--tRNA ligase [Herpetosiphonaceae bacterium]
MVFKEVDSKVSFPGLEQEVERWWKERDIVKKVLDSGDRSRPFIFFEGPPTANGRPGVHHVEARASKDIVIRYHRMRGEYVVGARGGWDTHGLPVEIEVEKELGFNGKPDIERYGIAQFNQACKASVWRYIQEWERMTNRIAFWIDLEHPYVTYHNEYIESLWWILKSFWEHGLLFRDYKVTMHCPRCGTSLSDHEVSLGFEDNVDDPSVWVRFRYQPSGHALDEQLAGASFLAWTTTPWTLPANAALAVKPGASYVLAEYTGGKEPERLVLAEALAQQVLGENTYRVLATFEGDSLYGARYENLFAGVPGQGETVDLAQAYRVVVDDFVSLEDGTGIVHIAPAYGDLEIGRKYGLPTLFSVDLAGNVLPEFNELGFGGMFFKEADPVITRNLKERGLLFRSGRVSHAYPFCWRCKTPLLYYAKPSWYIRTTAKKERLLANNQQIHWVPEHIKNGRFGNWLENNIDWALSRERYWGTPLPIWVCDSCGHTEVVGSLQELSERAGRDVQGLDLHRPYVDEVTWPCTKCDSGTARRVPDVADCWFDSGAMPVAQWHYPFENQEIFEVAGQADFISEAIDQTRGWFYTLHAVSTLLFDRSAFKNVICLGHILDINGEKMSKSRGNVVDPWQLLDNYGADATRWYMYASAPPYNPRRFAPEHVGEMLRQFMLTLWNTYAFFVTYANLDGWKPPVGANPVETLPPASLQLIDRWALGRLNMLVRDVTAMLDDYDIHGPAKEIERFVEDLSNWYVRRNRRRFWKAENDADKQAAYVTLYTCLTTLARLLAPFMPFVSEALYRNLVAEHDSNAPESVHLASWPEVNEALIDQQLLADMDLLLEAVSLGRAARRNAGIRIRQPLSELLVRAPRGGEGLRRFEDELRDELNVKSVRFLGVGDGLVEYRFKPNLPVVGKKYGKLVPKLKAALESLSGEAATAAAHAVEAGQPFELRVDGQLLHLEPNEVLLEARSPEGYAVAESGGLLVAFNTTLTPQLVLEGQARDLVRIIQDARKAADFDIVDRISVTVQPRDGDGVQPVLQTYGDYIRSETLAESLTVGPPEAGAHTVEAELGGQQLTVGVRKF